LRPPGAWVWPPVASHTRTRRIKPSTLLRNSDHPEKIGETGGRDMQAIDLELTNADVEVRQLEARLRVVPMNDAQLAQALQSALSAKRERLERLRARHASSNCSLSSPP